MSKKVAPGDIIQINEDGPIFWFRCLLVVDEVKSWGVQAYCTIPGSSEKRCGDAFIRLLWHEFDSVGAKSLFIVATADEARA